jgi:hypothetical protein
MTTLIRLGLRPNITDAVIVAQKVGIEHKRKPRHRSVNGAFGSASCGRGGGRVAEPQE